MKKHFNHILKGSLVILSLFLAVTTSAQLIINEIHADPAGDITGDANGDGVRDANADEFIEFVNIGSTPLDISGYRLFDSNSSVILRHVFPPNTIVPAGGAVVVFGGGTPTGTFGGSIVQIASEGSGIAATNTSETFVLEDAGNNPLLSFAYGSEANADQSITRSPDVTGGDSPMTAHTSASGADGRLFSPGTRADGTPFGGIIFNEIHADPAGDITGDANGDGVRDANQDEFIELVNSSLVDIDISGWKLYDNVSSRIERHVFPASTIVPAGGAIVIFGGGTPTGTFGGSIVQSASTGGLAATNTGETFDLVDAADNPILSLTYGAEANTDQSITRDPDITGGDAPMTGHTVAAGSGGTLYSPGTRVDGSPFLVPASTLVQLAATTALVNEGDVTIDIIISITSPSATTATTVDLVLTSGSAADINNYSTQTVTFPAGSSDNQLVTITITDDAEVEPDEDLVFELQNPGGGNSAEVTTPSAFTLSIQDNDFATSSLIINEYLAWPAGGTSTDPVIDANGDGAADIAEDEFIEFVNNGTVDLDISGWTIWDEYTQLLLRHTFPPGTIINPGGALVVFGGGNPTGDFGGAQIQLATNFNLGLTNTNDGIRVKNANDETIIYITYGQQKRGTSITLNPDVTGSLGPHPDLNGNFISPGTKVDGTPFAVATRTTVQFATPSGSAAEDGGSFQIELSITRPDENNATTAEVIITTTGFEDDIDFTTQQVTFPAGSADNQVITVNVINDDLLEGDELFQLTLQQVSGGRNATTGSPGTFEFVVNDDDVPLIFNEIHADPTSNTTGDANNDGIGHASFDEFIEVVNQSLEEIDLSGWRFYSGVSLRHTFPAGTTLEPGRALVVFGGGIPTGLFGGSEIQLASEGSLDLPDAGEVLRILDLNDELAAGITYGTIADNGQSITRNPDITGGLATHSGIEAAKGKLFSPGTKNDGALFINIVIDIEETSTERTRIYPNPTVDDLTITLYDTPPAVFVLYDLTAKEVIRVDLSEVTTILQLPVLTKGLYFYSLTHPGKMTHKGKIIVK